MDRSVFLLSLVLCFSVQGLVHGQSSKEELEKQRIETQRIIENTTRLLEQTSLNRQNSLERLNIVNRRLQLRQGLISTMESEVRFLDTSISNRQNKIKELETELVESRNSYASLINSAYKHRFAHQRMMFIFSAADFNQAYRRLKYLQQYSESRQKQILRIQDLTGEIFNEIEELEKQRKEKTVLLEQQKNESSLLSRERQQQNTLLQNLGKREAELKNELAQQEKVARALQNAIEELLKEEARLAAENRVFDLTPNEKIVSDQFQLNKGGLPWPTDRGVVTGFFGEHAHPVLKGIKVQNNGIDISTDENAEVKVLFDGVVRRVLTVPGSNNVILVRHGNYLSVYANLSHVYVRAGDNVQTRQLIGRVFTDNQENKSILHLEIWEENKKLDPIQWLSRQ
ncbi:MAG: murein hydrolase activator EnvC family protein [Bacteroidales bacterium]